MKNQPDNSFKQIKIGEKKHPNGFFYGFKKITKLFIDLGLRNLFIRGISLIFLIYFKGKNNIKVYGRKYLPKSGPYILVGNHSSVADALLLIAVFCGLEGRTFKYIAHEKDFQKDNAQRYFHMLFGGKPRKGRGVDLVKYMAQELLKGNVVAIPPEGMYNRENKIMKGYIGAGLAYPTSPGSDGKYHSHKIRIIGRYGKPFYLPRLDNITHEALHQQTDLIMEKISKLALQKEGPVESWILAEKERGVKRNY